MLNIFLIVTQFILFLFKSKPNSFLIDFSSCDFSKKVRLNLLDKLIRKLPVFESINDLSYPKAVAPLPTINIFLIKTILKI